MKSKKRIRLITISHYGELYGANRSLLTLIVSSKDRIKWLVICNKKGPFTHELEENGICYRMVPFFLDVHFGNDQSLARLVKDFLKLLANLTNLPYLLLLVLRHRPLAIHSNSSVFMVGAIVAYFSRIPHLWHIREFPELHGNTYYDFGGSWFRFWANKAKHIICVSTYLYKLRIVKNNIDANVIVLYNGIDSNEAANSEIMLPHFLRYSPFVGQRNGNL
jgi:hypothetical protein